MFRILFILSLLLPLALTAQQGRDSIDYQEQKKQPGVINKANFQDIYLRLADTFYGGFGADTQCSIIKYIISGATDRSNSEYHELRGRSWHFGIENKFQIKPQIISVGHIPFDECIDTFYTTSKAKNIIDSMVKLGWEIHFVEGYYTLTEDTTEKFAGETKGVFKITFLFHPSRNEVASIPRIVLLREPSVVFSGLWNPKNRNDINVPQFFCSLIPHITKTREVLLPDFRLQQDGQVRPENWISLKTRPTGLPR